jgi:sulfite reductase beta subunit-like hemoprotein
MAALYGDGFNRSRQARKLDGVALQRPSYCLVWLRSVGGMLKSDTLAGVDDAARAVVGTIARSCCWTTIE